MNECKKNYTFTEVTTNFKVLLEQMDFERELSLLNLGKMRFILRRQMKKEWLAVVIALWRLALERSFPLDNEEIFNMFLTERMQTLKNKKLADNFNALVLAYVELFKIKAENDFTLPAEQIITKLKLTEVEAKVVRLRLILHLRKLYTLIFERLI